MVSDGTQPSIDQKIEDRNLKQLDKIGLYVGRCQRSHQDLTDLNTNYEVVFHTVSWPTQLQD